VLKNRLLSNFINLKNAKDLEELPQFKTPNSKTFRDKKTNKLESVFYAKPLHYEKNNELIEEVHEFVSTSYGWKMIQANLEARLPLKSDGEMWAGTIEENIKFHAIGTNSIVGQKKEVDDLNLNPTKFQYPFIHYIDAWTDADLIYYTTGNSVSKYIIIKSKNASKQYEFDITLDNLSLGLYTNKESDTWIESDENIKCIDIINSNNENSGYLFYPFATDSIGIRPQVGREITHIEGNKFRIKITLDNKFFEHAVFPIQLDPLFSTAGLLSSSGYGMWEVHNPSAGHGTAGQYPTLDTHANSVYSTGSGVDTGVWNQATHPNGCYHAVRRGFMTWDTGSLRNRTGFYVLSATIYMKLLSYTQLGECHEDEDYDTWPIYIYSLAQRNNMSSSVWEVTYDIDAFHIEVSNETDTWNTSPWTLAVRKALISDNQQYIAIKVFQSWDREGFSLWPESGGPHGGNYSNCVNIFTYSTDSYISINWTATPEAPINLTVEDTHQNSLELNWTSTSTVSTYYRIDRKAGSGSWVVNYATSTLDATTYTDINTYQDIIYTYRIRAYNTDHPTEAYRYSSYSNEASASYSILPPTDFDAEHVGNRNVELNWTNTEPYFDTLELQKNVNNAGWSSLTTLDDLVITYDDLSVQERVVIVYRIRSKRSPNNPSYSVWVLSPEIICDLPAPVLLLTNKTRYKNELVWNDIGTLYNYISLERSINGSEWEQIETIDYPTLIYYDRDVYPRDDFYAYRARVYNQYFVNPWSSYGLSTPHQLWISIEMRERKYFYNDIN
jgi:hypothetical protein